MTLSKSTFKVHLAMVVIAILAFIQGKEAVDLPVARQDTEFASTANMLDQESRQNKGVPRVEEPLPRSFSSIAHSETRGDVLEYLSFKEACRFLTSVCKAMPDKVGGMLQHTHNRPNVSDDELGYILFAAISHARADTIKTMSECGQISTDIIQNALLRAVKAGSLNVVQALAECSTKNAASNNGTNIGTEHFDLASLLADQRFSVHDDDEMATRVAAKLGHLEIVKYLFSIGANLHINDNEPFRLAAANGHLELVKFLFESGADAHTIFDYALRHAAKNGHLDTVRYLVEELHSDVHAENDEALKCAARNGHEAIVKLLLELNPTDFSCANDGEALESASENGHFGIVQLLMENAPVIISHVTDAMQAAVMNGHMDIVKYFVDLSGVDIVVAGDCVALYIAARHGPLEAVQYVDQVCREHLATGTIDYDEALSNSVINGNLDVVEYLISRGADPLAEGSEILMLATRHAHFDIVKYLVSVHKVDIHVKGDFALQWAAFVGHFGIVQFLVGQDPEYYSANAGAIAGVSMAICTKFHDIHKFHSNNDNLGDPEGFNSISSHLEIGKYLVNHVLSTRNDPLPVHFVMPFSLFSSNVSLIERLVETGSNIHFPDDEFVLGAVLMGNLEIVKYLVSVRGFNIHTSNNEALVLAANHGHLEIVKYILEEHPVDGLVNSDDDKALRSASKCGHLAIVKYLAEHGANVHALDDEAVKLAAYFGKIDVVKYLVEHCGAIFNIASSAAHGGHLKVIKYLLSRGASLDANDNEAFRLAVGSGHIEIANFIANRIGNIFHASGNQALTLAAGGGHFEVCQWLVWHKANVRFGDDLAIRQAARYQSHATNLQRFYLEDHSTRYAAYNDLNATINFLISHNANIDAEVNTAVRLAAENGYIRAVKLLTKHGADISAFDNEALRRAALHGNSRVVEFLIMHGANIQANDNEAIKMAALRGHFYIVKLLARHGADTRAGGNEPIRLASMNDHLHIVKFLMDYGTSNRSVHDEIARPNR